jgi:hypothetical protein
MPPPGLCECGCGQRTTISPVTVRRNGYLKGEPRRFVRGHANRLQGPDYEVVDTGHKTPCWLWRKGCGTRGYGRLRIGGKPRQAHVIYYERAHGPVPRGLQLDHLCRQHGRVNPDHLEPVTNAENSRRGLNRKLTVAQVQEIRAAAGRHRDIAARYGVVQSTVTAIKARRLWGDP